MARAVEESDAPVYRYEMTHVPSRSIWGSTPGWMGAGHGEELQYVFGWGLRIRDQTQKRRSCPYRSCAIGQTSSRRGQWSCYMNFILQNVSVNFYRFFFFFCRVNACFHMIWNSTCHNLVLQNTRLVILEEVHLIGQFLFEAIFINSQSKICFTLWAFAYCLPCRLRRTVGQNETKLRQNSFHTKLRCGQLRCSQV